MNKRELESEDIVVKFETDARTDEAAPPAPLGTELSLDLLFNRTAARRAFRRALRAHADARIARNAHDSNA